MHVDTFYDFSQLSSNQKCKKLYICTVDKKVGMLFYKAANKVNLRCTITHKMGQKHQISITLKHVSEAKQMTAAELSEILTHGLQKLTKEADENVNSAKTKEQIRKEMDEHLTRVMGDTGKRKTRRIEPDPERRPYVPFLLSYTNTSR